MQLVIFLSTFNAPYMRPNIQCDGWKRKYFWFVWEVNGASRPKFQTPVLDYVLVSRTPLQRSGHLSHSLAIALVGAHIYGSSFVRPPPAPWFVERR
jgi:hypothetical protein